MAKDFEEVSLWFLKHNEKINELEKVTRSQNLSLLQLIILKRIEKGEDVYPTDIAKDIGISKSSVSRTLKSLYVNGLIKKEHDDDEDTRRVKINITSKAKKIINPLTKKLVSVF